MAVDQRYLDGLIGSRDELSQFAPLLPHDRDAVLETVRRQPHDPSFARFVEQVRRAGAELEIVSDGYGFYVEPGLATIGVTGVPIYSAETTWTDEGPSIAFPNGHPACYVCGTCKRERVLHHKRAGRHTVLVGDGPSDRYAAAHADTIFAKSLLAGICEQEGWAFRAWTTFGDVAAWLEGQAMVPDGIAPPVDRPFICGPEVWGPGRHGPR